MPSERTARVSERRRLRNRPIRVAARTHVRKAQDTIASGDLATAVQDTHEAIKVLDQAAQKGVIHRNNAARRKSRLMTKLNRLTAAQA